MYILAIIGLIFLMWFLSKGLTRFGKWLERTGDTLINLSTALRKTGIKPRTNKASQSVTKCNQLNTDKKFNEAIKKEIEELTNPEE